MSGKVAYIAALRREISALTQGLNLSETAPNLLVCTSDRVAIVAAGMGAHRVSLAVQTALQDSEVEELVSIGVAGACHSGHAVGAVLAPAEVVDARTGERFSCEHGQGVLVSVAAVASVPEKARLRRTYNADLVDMEAATVARLARAKGLRFRAIKSVSDGPNFELSDTSRFATREGQFREAAFALYAAVRPRLWKPLLELAQNSKLAIGNLTAAVRADIERTIGAE